MLTFAVLRAWDSATYTATVEPRAGSAIAGVLVDRGIPSAEMVLGRTVVLVILNASSAAGMMVIGIH